MKHGNATDTQMLLTDFLMMYVIIIPLFIKIPIEIIKLMTKALFLVA